MLDPVLDKGGHGDGQDLPQGSSPSVRETKQVTITYNLTKAMVGEERLQKARRGAPTQPRHQGRLPVGGDILTEF